jgi:hypothetical protein
LGILIYAMKMLPSPAFLFFVRPRRFRAGAKNSKRAPTQPAFFSRLGGFLTRLTVGPDSFADITIIRPSCVDKQWTTVKVKPVSVAGIGGLCPTPMDTAVRVPIRLQYGSALSYIYAYVGDTPKNVDMLMGCDVLDFFSASVDRRAFRTEIRSQGLAIPMATITEN